MRVSVLGATGMVGQKLVEMILLDPALELGELVASESRIGRTYGSQVEWRGQEDLPSEVAGKVLKGFEEITGAVVSALPAEIARDVEVMLCEKGCEVFSNASAYRMREDVPLLIPEINLKHLNLVKKQPWKGALVTNPNCSTVFLSMGLYPLSCLGEVEEVHAVTLQAASGAGLPGVPSVDLLGSVIPFISGEEEKMERESCKILGTSEVPASFQITAQANRVPVVDGHLVCLQVRMKQEISVALFKEKIVEFERKFPRGWKLWEAENMPQTRRVLNAFDMRTHIGKIRQGADPRSIALVALGHNLVRGAAGAALANLKAYQEFKSR